LRHATSSVRPSLAHRVQDAVVFEFDDCRLDTALFRLERAGAVVRVQPRVFDVLCYLIEHRDRVIPRTELLATFWPDVAVLPIVVPWSISRARRAMGQKLPRQYPIRVLRRVGYQFVADVRIGLRPRSRASHG
jgi:DNA-binding winged helix-turn-helix (wHTH) protein